MSDQDKPENETPSAEGLDANASHADLKAAADELLKKAAAAQEEGEAADAMPELSEEEQIAVAMEALAAENADLKDKLLRAAAEVENIRRRSEREKADALKYGAANFARDILAVADNLRRALDSVPDDRRDGSDDVVKSIIEGVEMTERSVLAAFEKNGITPVEPALGDKFDPNHHEAMFEVPGTGQPSGSIVQVVEVGYLIGDRLLRAARVGVAKGDVAPAGGSVDTTA